MNKAEIMTKKHDKKCPQVPRLRFPEFQNAGKWKWNKLKEVCEINPSSGALPQTFVYIDLESVSSGKLLSKKTMLLEDAPSRAQRLVKNGDILFQMVRPYQKNNLYCNFNDTRNYVASTGYAILRASENSKFLYQAIHCDDFVDRVISKCTGSNYPAINSSHLSELVISTPILQEQQRIADCLSSLDERIAAETSKLDRLKDHKKGLLKQLFPAEGETLPQLRFPDFRDAGEWGQAPLGELLLSQPDYGLNAPAVPYTSSLPTYIRITDISEGGQFIAEKKVSVDVVAVPENCLHPGDIVLARTGASVGKAYKYNENDGILVFAGFLIRVKPNWKKINSNFLFNFLFTKRYWDWVVLTSPRSGQPGINSSEYATLPVPTPPSDGDMQCEQQRIADCLSSLDELIAAQTQKIDLLNEHKKGLMQQLFPRIDEVLA